MTASITPRSTASAASIPAAGFLPGFGALLRKELTEWRRARRTWVVFLASVLFMALGAFNAWLISNLPADVTEGGRASQHGPAGQPDRPDLDARLRHRRHLRGDRADHRRARERHAGLDGLEAGLAQRDLAGEVRIGDRDHVARRRHPAAGRRPSPRGLPVRVGSRQPRSRPSRSGWAW